MIKYPSRTLFVTGLIALLGSGCAERSVTTPVDAQATTIVALPNGNDIVGFAGYSLEDPLRVQVLVNGVAAANVEVIWRASGGVVTPQATTTNAQGIVAAAWQLGVVPGKQTITASVKRAPGVFVEIVVTVRPEIAIEIVDNTNDQIGTVATALSRPLQLRVSSNRIPQAGLAVVWVGDGEFTTSGVTDANGIATAIWTLATLARPYEAQARVMGHSKIPRVFRATAESGPVVALVRTSQPNPVQPANHPLISPLRVTAVDAYDNPVPMAKIDWSVDLGPVRLVSADPHADLQGRSSATVTPTGIAGTAVVRAQAAGISQEFVLTIMPPIFVVELNTMIPRFESLPNGTTAVDTILVGHVMTWRLAPFDYDQHSITIVGKTSESLGEFPYANPSEIRWLATMRGTYHYNDRYTGATGVIVVR